jgi:DNA-binding transcriptional regulator YhcF (GntR family)
LAGLVVDPHDQIPAHVQIKDQFKFARTCQELRQGDVLPSIRGLARQVSVGDGVVRRAYRELREIGLLATERRKHVIVAPGPGAASNTDGARASVAQCDRLIAWAARNRLSAIALARLLLRRALTREAASPSYLFVDICRRAAEESVLKISRLWGIKVAGVSVGDFTKLGNGSTRHLSAVLVNEYLYEDVMAAAGEIRPRVFSVRVRLDERLLRRIRRLPKRSTVLLVCSDDDFSRTGGAMLRHYEHVFGSRWRFQAKKVSEIPDLAGFIRAQRYRLTLFSLLVWETLPGRIKRMVRVAPAFCEPDPRSLEETRIAAGVLL